MTTQPVGQDDLAWFSEQFQSVSANIERVIQGKRGVIELIVMSLLSEGHVLVEDVPVSVRRCLPNRCRAASTATSNESSSPRTSCHRT